MMVCFFKVEFQYIQKCCCSTFDDADYSDDEDDDDLICGMIDRR